MEDERDNGWEGEEEEEEEEEEDDDDDFLAENADDVLGFEYHWGLQNLNWDG